MIGKSFINPKGKAELMAGLTSLLYDEINSKPDFDLLPKRKQIKIINNLADGIFALFSKNLIFKRNDNSKQRRKAN